MNAAPAPVSRIWALLAVEVQLGRRTTLAYPPGRKPFDIAGPSGSDPGRHGCSCVSDNGR